MRRWFIHCVWIVGGATLASGSRWAFKPVLDDHVYYGAAVAIVAVVAAARGATPGVLTGLACAILTIVSWMSGSDIVGRDRVVLAGVFLASTVVVALVAGRRTEAPDDLPLVLRPRLPVRSTALLIAAGISPIVFCTFVGWATYQDAIAAAYARLERTASIASEHLLRVIEVNRVVTRSLVHEISDQSDEALRQQEPRLHSYVRGLALGADQIQSIWVWDAQGRPLLSSLDQSATSTFDVSDREYFRAHRDAGEAWYVSGTLQSRTTGKPFFGVSVRREVGGRFAGVVSVSLHPGYFSDFYAKLARAEPGLRIGLWREKGELVARWPSPCGVIESRSPARDLMTRIQAGETHGTLRSVSHSDGAVRHVVFSRTNGYPLYVVVALDRAAILAAWYRDMSMLAMVVVPGSLGLVWLLFVAFERSERMQAALASAREEAQQRSRAEDALRHAQKLEALGLLTGGVAHDFNNLLAVVSNSAYLLRHLQSRRSAGEDEIAPVAAISRAVESGTKLTRQLLAFSRRQPLAPEVVDVHGVLSSMMDLLRTIVSRRIELGATLAENLPRVKVDPAELELAVINLVINARDAISGRGRIDIDAAAWYEDGREFVRIGVRDNGAGIPAHLRERVFEPFFTTKPRGTGTGLGLSQVYGFCTQAGGAVSLAANPEGGTVVTMLLPATAEVRAQLPATDRGIPTRIEARVLLVEDNDDIGATMREVLKSLGAEVTYVRSGDDALRVLTQDAGRFDLVVSDVAMPGSLTGIELAQQCRRRWPQLAIVLMTGYTAELQAAVQDGFTVLAKPFVPEALARVVARRLVGTSSPS
jgi:signal transduction histidine kinase